MSLSQPQAASIALNRFGLGARPDEAPPADPQRWLLDQFDRFEPKPAAFAALPPPGSLANAYFAEVGELIKKMGAAPTPPGAPAPMPMPMADDAAAKAERQQKRQALGVEVRDTYRLGINARMASALETQAPFVERLASFWSNHFALSIEKPQVGIFAAAY